MGHKENGSGWWLKPKRVYHCANIETQLQKTSQSVAQPLAQCLPMPIDQRLTIANHYASLLFSCKDEVGIGAALGNYFSSRGLSITSHAQYTDAGRVFSRIEWCLNDRWEDEQAFEAEFTELAKQYDAEFSARFMNRTQNVGLFVSNQPHALIEILNRAEAQYFPRMEISFIIGSEQSAQSIADRHGVPFFYVDTSGDALNYEKKQLEIVQRYKPDCLGLARYMKVLSANFLSKVNCSVININHSFLPSFVGSEPYAMAYERGVKLVGATSQFVSAELDKGAIIEQDVVRVNVAASEQDMLKLSRNIERKVFARALLKVLEHKTLIDKNRAIVFD